MPTIDPPSVEELCVYRITLNSVGGGIEVRYPLDPLTSENFADLSTVQRYSDTPWASPLIRGVESISLRVHGEGPTTVYTLQLCSLSRLVSDRKEALNVRVHSLRDRIDKCTDEAESLTLLQSKLPTLSEGQRCYKVLLGKHSHINTESLDG